MNRSRHRLRIAAMVLGTLLVFAGAVWTWASLTYSRKLEQELTSLRARGFALSMSELLPRPVPDEQNAATIYMPLFNVNFAPEQAAQPKGQLDQYQLPASLNFRHPEVTLELRAAMRKPGVQHALMELRRASQRPYSVFPVRWELGPSTLFPHYQQFRHGTRLVVAQALIDADAGRLPQALAWLQVGYRMADHVSQEPILISQLAGYACRSMLFAATQRIVCAHDISAAEARPLLEQLAVADLSNDFHRAMLGEMASGLDFFPSVTKNLAGLAGDPPSPMLTVIGWLAGTRLGRPYWELEEYNYARLMAPSVEATFQPYRLEASKPSRPSTALGPGGPGYVMVSLLMPVMGRASAFRDESLSQIRLVQVALALKSYRHDHPAYPATLAALPGETPQDPFSGKDFVYRRVGRGFQLYSIGPNLKDDGGRQASKPGRRMDEGDIVWNCPR